MILKTTDTTRHSKSFLKTLKTTTAIALLSVSTLALSTAHVEASLGADETTALLANGGHGAGASTRPAIMVADIDGAVAPLAITKEDAEVAFTAMVKALTLLNHDTRRKAQAAKKDAYGEYELGKYKYAWAQRLILQTHFQTIHAEHHKLLALLAQRDLTIAAQQATIEGTQQLNVSVQRDDADLEAQAHNAMVPRPAWYKHIILPWNWCLWPWNWTSFLTRR